MRSIEEVAKNKTSISNNKTTKRHLRGSSLLLAGRLFSLLVNFGVQVLTVRYLAKSDYGAFAYALSIVAMGTSVAILGLNKAVPRFVPIYHENGDYNSALGTIVLALGTVAGIGLSLIVLVFGLQGFLTNSVASDPLSIGLLLILIALSPIQAFENLFQGLFAIFADPRAIFFCRHILGPGLKLAAVLIVVLIQGDVQTLAICYLIGGALGLGVYILILHRVLKSQEMFQNFSFKTINMPIREIFGFSIPLLSLDAFLILKTTMAVILLEYYRGTIDVAEFRAVVPIAALCLVVFQSLKLLYTPIASRMFAKNDIAGINDLYWQSAIWITIVTFPVFAVCFLLAEPVTVLLFGASYAEAGVILAVLVVGDYFNAALGLNTYTLQVFAKVRFITWINCIAAAIVLLLNLWLIPLYGALGAAIATSGAVVIHNLLIHSGLWFGTGIDLFQWRHLKVYLSVVVVTLSLLMFDSFYTPPIYLMVILIALTSLLLFVVNRNILNIAHTFPEISRIPLLGKLLGAKRDA
jgi:O-antigen/teichoic acid export membrane protein